MSIDVAMREMTTARSQLFVHSQQRITMIRHRGKGVKAVTTEQVEAVNEQIEQDRAQLDAARRAVRTALLQEV